MDLISSCNRVLGVSRQSTLTIDKYEGLVIISGTVGGGKNTLLSGIMKWTNQEDNHVIYTETRFGDCSVLLDCISYYSELIGFNIEQVVEIITKSPAKNIFIEQYHNNGGWEQPVNDMKTLAKLAKDLNKNINICVNREREVL